MLCIICPLLERVSAALGWVDTGAGGTAGFMYSVRMFKSKGYDTLSSK